MNPACLLCQHTFTGQYLASEEFSFFECPNCGIVFKSPSIFLNRTEEKKRYLKHENRVDDEGYRAFVSPVVEHILANFDPAKKGLDFGAGPGPVVAKMLNEKGYKVDLYDPFFYPNKDALHNTYDFIFCCEVIEHFHSPASEFKLLRKLLNSKGSLICMTHLLPKKESFSDWYYKNDSTHVVFYSEKSIQWIKENFGFSQVSIDDRLIVFRD